MYGIILIAVLAVMGGLIAYIGDQLGTKVGKKRMSVFGLRPRHTSIVVTVITGICIAGATLGAMSVASQDVRTALFGMEALKKELATLAADVQSKNQDLAASHALLEQKGVELSGLAAQIDTTSAKLAAVGRELAAASSERDRATTALAEAQRTYSQEIGALQQVKTELDERVTTLTETRNSLQGDIDRLNELTAKLRQGIQVVREGTIIFRAGEILSTFTVIGGDRPGAEKLLLQAINQTNQNVLDRLEIKDKEIEVLWVSQTDFEEALHIIAKVQGEVIVRIASAGNVVYGEPVFVQLELFPNNLIYQAGDKVLSTQIDAVYSQGQAEEATLKFLQQVNAAAIQKGVLPDPIAGTVGSIGGAQLYDTVNKVKRVSGRMEIVAYAKGDIHTIGPLKVDIVVRGLP